VICGKGFTVICAAALFVGSAMEAAVIIAVCGLAKFDGWGALYVTPTSVGFESDPGPLRDQLSPMFFESFTRFAETNTVSPWSVCAEVGETVTEIGGGAELEHPVINAAAENPMVTSASENAGRISVPLLRHYWATRSRERRPDLR